MNNFDNKTSFSLGIITGGSIVGLLLCKRINLIKRKYINMKILFNDTNTELIMKKDSLITSCNNFQSSEQRYNELKKSFEKIQNVNNTLTGDLKALEYRINDSQNYRSEINSLVENALRSPNARGMSRICDFDTQVILPDGSRPDMVIKLTGNRCIVVDSKVPLTSYQEAVACSDSNLADELYKKHADAVKTHITSLSKKQYPGSMNGLSPDFVVLFLPSESLYSSALLHRPQLLEYAAASKVVITSPSTLMALLRMVDYGWQRQEINDKPQEIANIGHELFNQSGVLIDNYRTMRAALDKVIQAYNNSVSSFDVHLNTAKELSKFSSGKTFKATPNVITTKIKRVSELTTDDSMDNKEIER